VSEKAGAPAHRTSLCEEENAHSRPFVEVHPSHGAWEALIVLGLHHESAFRVVAHQGVAADPRDQVKGARYLSPSRLGHPEGEATGRALARVWERKGFLPKCVGIRPEAINDDDVGAVKLAKR